MKKQLTVAFLVSLTVACGGGGDSEQESIDTPPAVTPQVSTADLVAPAEFKFSTTRNVEFNIEAPTLAGKRGFVSVYTDYILINGSQPFPEYNSRIFMMPLENDKVALGTKIPNDVREVLVQVVSDNVSDGVALSVLSIDGNNSVTWSY